MTITLFAVAGTLISFSIISRGAMGIILKLNIGDLELGDFLGLSQDETPFIVWFLVKFLSTMQHQLCCSMQSRTLTLQISVASYSYNLLAVSFICSARAPFSD